MDEIKRILSDDIERLNRKEKRDNKIRFNPGFIRKHPYLFGGMLLCYLPVMLILAFADYFGIGYVVGFTLFVLGVSLGLSCHVSPRYHFDDIDQMDLRVCYNGEWFNKRSISQQAYAQIQSSSEVPPEVKQGVEQIQLSKGKVTFFDVYALVYLKPEAAAV